MCKRNGTVRREYAFLFTKDEFDNCYTVNSLTKRNLIRLSKKVFKRVLLKEYCLNKQKITQ